MLKVISPGKTMTILNFLKQPHPDHADVARYFRFVTYIWLGVFLVLVTFRPFSLSQFQGLYMFLYPLAYSLVAYSSMLLASLWIIICPSLFEEKTWTLGKEMLWATYQMLSISIFLHIFGPLISPYPGMFADYGFAFKATMLGGLLPYLINTGFRHYYLLKSNFEAAKRLNQQLRKAVSPQVNGNHYKEIIIAENSLKLNPKDIQYIESVGNYLNIYVLKGEPIKIRATLKEAFATLQAFPQFVRCHRAFIVNIDLICKIEGNAAGLRLHMSDDDLPQVPVSRSHTAMLRGLLEQKEP
ncbi:MAG: LytR/AlgR family response regulator transcription factor [Cyclobacteriaceae bacterium]